MNKECRICGESLPATDDFFPITRGYLRGECWECFYKRNKERAKENRTSNSERVRKWRKANPEKFKVIVKRSKAKGESRMNETLKQIRAKRANETRIIEEQKKLKEDEYTRQWKNCKRTVNDTVNKV